MKTTTASLARIAAVVLAVCFLGSYVLHSMGYLELPMLQSRASRQKIMASSKDAIIYEAAIDQWAAENNKQNSVAARTGQEDAYNVLIGGSKSFVPLLKADNPDFGDGAKDYRVRRKHLEPKTEGTPQGEEVVTVPIVPLELAPKAEDAPPVRGRGPKSAVPPIQVPRTTLTPPPVQQKQPAASSAP